MSSFLREWRGWWPGKTGWFGNPQFVVGEKITAPDPGEVALHSLRAAVQLMVDSDVEQEDRETRTIPGGFHAYRRWWEDLQQDLQYDEMDRRERMALLIFNGRFLNRLIEARRGVSAYLDQVRTSFDGENRVRLEQASTHYRTVADQLAQIQQLLPQGDFRMRELPDEEIAKSVHRPKVAELVQVTYREEHAAISLLGGVVDMSVPPLETWTSTEAMQERTKTDTTRISPRDVELEQALSEMRARLQLTRVQEMYIRSILQESMAKQRALREEMQEQDRQNRRSIMQAMRKEQEDTDKRIEAVLSEEQVRAYRTLREEQQEKMREQRRQRRGGR